MTKIQINSATPEGARALRLAGIDASAGGWFSVQYGGDPLSVLEASGVDASLIVEGARNQDGRLVLPGGASVPLGAPAIPPTVAFFVADEKNGNRPDLPKRDEGQKAQPPGAFPEQGAKAAPKPGKR